MVSARLQVRGPSQAAKPESGAQESTGGSGQMLEGATPWGHLALGKQRKPSSSRRKENEQSQDGKALPSAASLRHLPLAERNSVSAGGGERRQARWHRGRVYLELRGNMWKTNTHLWCPLTVSTH